MDQELYITDVDCGQPLAKKRQLRTRIQTLNQNVWRKMKNRLNSSLKGEDYYEGKRLRPGINFFKILLENYEAGSPNIQQVQANIPETMCMQSNRYNIVCTKQGRLHRLVEASFQQFERLVVPEGCPNHLENRYIQPQQQDQIAKDKLTDLEHLHGLPELPLFVSRLAAGINFNKHIINAGQYRLKPLPTNENELYQRYIIPYQFRANLVRLHFFTRNSREQQKSEGWKLTNNCPMFDPKDVKKSLTSANLIINFDKEGSFECIALKGKSLEQYERMAESVLSYLEECRDIVVREAVFDFTVDYHRVPWIVGLRMVRYDSRTALPNRLTEEQKVRQMEQTTFSATCRLCGVFFHKDNVNKLLTCKLLTELLEHLKKRNKRLSDIHLTDSSTRYCKVCNLCYTLVVAEHNLINVEQELSIVQGIIQEEQLVRMTGVPRNQDRSMLQWRMMLYVEEINDVHLPAWDTEQIYFQFKIQNFRTKFLVQTASGSSHSKSSKKMTRPKTSHHKTSVIERDESTWECTKLNSKTINGEEESIKVKRIKVQYFFSGSPDIAGFLNDTELKFRLTRTSDWNDFFAEGNSRTISHFNNKLKQGQRHSGEILLFSADMKHARLQLHMGLVCDGVYSTDGIALTEVNGVHFPTDTYYNCNPFPEVWMEIFQEDIGLDRVQGTSEQLELEESHLSRIDYSKFDCVEARKIRRMLAN